MLRNSLSLLGRWSSRDFLKGRGKCAGAVHIRSTLGSRGRVQSWSRSHGFRDGQPNDLSFSKGALGVRLGGGLFGPRVPMHTMLEAMDKETMDLAFYGHPSITNPFRDKLEEHPRLGDVVAGPSGSAWLAFPVGDSMWFRRKQQQQQQQQQTQVYRNTSNNNNNESPAESLMWQLRREEREFVVNKATDFLTRGAFGDSNENLWADRNVLIGSRSDSVVLSSRTMLGIFGEMVALKKTQQQGDNNNNDDNGDSDSQKDLQEGFVNFVHNSIVEACRFSLAPLRSRFPPAQKQQQQQQQQQQQDASTISLLPDSFLRRGKGFADSVLLEAPFSFRAVLPPHRKEAVASLAEHSNNNNNKSSTDNTSALLKWYLRSSDPRSHFGQGGHSGSRFTVVAICPFDSPNSSWITPLKRHQGFVDIRQQQQQEEQGEQQQQHHERFFHEVARAVIDDSEHRVAVPPEHLRHARPVGKHDAENINESPFTGLEVNPKLRQELLPHLNVKRGVLQRAWGLTEQKQHVKQDEMFKSYFATS